MPKLSPLFWFGSKGNQLDKLRYALPISFDYLIEPFAGSATFSLAMIQECFIGSTNVWLNDKNPSCMAFYETLRDNPERLISDLRDIQNENGLGNKPLFLKHHAQILNPIGDVFSLAISQYIVNNLGFGGKAPNKGNYCNPFKSFKGLRVSRIESLRTFAALLQGTKQSCGDYRDIEVPTSNTLVNYDPPYGKEASNTPDSDSYGKDLTISEIDFFEHCESQRDKCHLLISYGDTPKAVEAFAGWNVYRIPVVRHNGKNRNQTELLITNYDIPYAEMLDDEWQVAV